MAIYREAISTEIERTDKELRTLGTDVERVCGRQRVAQKRIRRKNLDGESEDVVTAWVYRLM